MCQIFALFWHKLSGFLLRWNYSANCSHPAKREHITIKRSPAFFQILLFSQTPPFPPMPSSLKKGQLICKHMILSLVHRRHLSKYKLKAGILPTPPTPRLCAAQRQRGSLPRSCYLHLHIVVFLLPFHLWANDKEHHFWRYTLSRCLGTPPLACSLALHILCDKLKRCLIVTGTWKSIQKVHIQRHK